MGNPLLAKPHGTFMDGRPSMFAKLWRNGKANRSVDTSVVIAGAVAETLRRDEPVETVLQRKIPVPLDVTPGRCPLGQEIVRAKQQFAELQHDPCLFDVAVGPFTKKGLVVGACIGGDYVDKDAVHQLEFGIPGSRPRRAPWSTSLAIAASTASRYSGSRSLKK